MQTGVLIRWCIELYTPPGKRNLYISLGYIEINIDIGVLMKSDRKDQAAEAFKRVTRARDVLLDPDRRREVDLQHSADAWLFLHQQLP